MCAVVLRRPRNSSSSAGIPGAKRAPFPGFIAPCDPTLRDRAPDGSGWLHEIKIDGYRAQVQIHHGRITVYSRSGYNWTHHFQQIAHAVKALSGHDLIIDGEATVFGNTGLPDFQALRRELAKKHESNVDSAGRPSGNQETRMLAIRPPGTNRRDRAFNREKALCPAPQALDWSASYS
jgi:bifunctional non-homologous end joining protein LigD